MAQLSDLVRSIRLPAAPFQMPSLTAPGMVTQYTGLSKLEAFTLAVVMSGGVANEMTAEANVDRALMQLQALERLCPSCLRPREVRHIGTLPADTSYICRTSGCEHCEAE